VGRGAHGRAAGGRGRARRDSRGRAPRDRDAHDGPDDQVEPALRELWSLLAAYPELDERFSRLRIVDDAVEFLKT
jgi:hypothetical protein